MRLEERKARLIRMLCLRGITDAAVLAAMSDVPRDAFVPLALREEAWEDCPLSIGHGQTISQPLVVALMTGALEVAQDHRVLEIGTGSGYQSAVLARLSRQVYTIERHRPLLAAATQRFRALNISGIVASWADGIKGWPERAPFDRIMVTAGACGTDPPAALVDQLAVGGVLIIPLGPDRWEQRIIRFRRWETGLQREELWPVRFVPLLPDLPPET